MNAGFRAVEIPFPTLVFYPAESAERTEMRGPYELSVALDAPVAEGVFPLVVISHGSGGSPMSHRTLAAYLARNGFVVAMPEHSGNNRNDNSLVDTVDNLANRPPHVRQVMDWMFSSGGFQASVLPDRAVIIGHSMGGYTALAAAGGIPTAFSRETPDQKARRIDVEADHRVKALVLLAPATPWFMAAGALNGVRLPILMWTGEKDAITGQFHSDIVLAGVPDKALLEHRIAANAGHFSFLSPFPVAMTNPGFLPSQDPERFDRERFQAELNSGVLEFLRTI